jgi:branched-chain amino acid transport system ATP-binding protein
VERIVKRFGDFTAVKGISFQVADGEVFGLLGPNGAGKRTLIRMMTPLIPITEGRALIDGHDVAEDPDSARRCMGVIPQALTSDINLTVEENLRVPMDRPGPFTVERVYQLFPRLQERRTSRGRQLSGGEQEMLSIARALLLNPKLLMLDEPSQGLAPLIVKQVFDTVVAMRKEGISILLVEQNVRAAVEIADRAYVLESGRVALSGSGAELLRDDDVRKAYLAI